ncbi:UvrD-helicase domain-containing protein [Bacillus cereus]
MIQKYSKQPIQELYKQKKCVYGELSPAYREYIQERFTNGCFDLHLIGGVANLILMSSKVCGNYLKAKYPFVFMDEFQDSDFEQFNLFRRFAELGITSWAVGDFNQSIYSFKSGSPEYMEQLIGMESFQLFEMKINHRCHSFIQEYANLFLSIQNGETMAVGPEGKSRIVRISIPGAQYQFGEWLNQNLEEIINMSGVEKKSNIAVLGRTHKTLEMVAEVLRIPHRLHRNLLINEERSVSGNILKQLLMLTFNPREYTTRDFIDSYFDNRVRGIRRNIDSVKKTY